MLLSDRGAFFSHIVLADDPAGKRQMLAAVLGKLVPPLWADMARDAAGAGRSRGPPAGAEALAALVQASGNAAAVERLGKALETLRGRRLPGPTRSIPRRSSRPARRHGLLVEAYLRAEPGKAREGRAFWNHSGTGAYPGDWERTAKELAGRRVQHGRAQHALGRPGPLRQRRAAAERDLRSNTATRSPSAWPPPTPRPGGPRLEGELQPLRRARGVRRQAAPRGPHAGLGRAASRSTGSAPRIRRTSSWNWRACWRSRGSTTWTACTSTTSAIPTASTATATAAAAVRGRERPARWPTGRRTATAARGARSIARWRCRQITRLVEAVHREAKKIRPAIKISAAVFGAYPACRESVGQDWVGLGRRPATSTSSARWTTPRATWRFAGLVANQLKLVDGRVPVYPGIGATASRSALRPTAWSGQIHQARSLGAAGFTIFNLDRETIGQIVPAVGLGAGSQKATPPHRPN